MWQPENRQKSYGIKNDAIAKSTKMSVTLTDTPPILLYQMRLQLFPIWKRFYSPLKWQSAFHPYPHTFHEKRSAGILYLKNHFSNLIKLSEWLLVVDGARSSF